MGAVKNILFVMADQLRWDHLSCYGHPHLRTPAMDAIAHKGVRFDRAYVNATVCGPSRMCFYTGRSMTSHGSTWNRVPLRVGEPTLGDHLRRQQMRVALVGKTHMTADVPGMERLGVSGESIEGVFARECGFEPYDRDDGLHPSQGDTDFAYNRYLRKLGYDVQNPWHDYANAGAGENGEVLSGWYLRNARVPARIAEEHSETAYTTNRAMDFIREAGDQPWCLHLSYIKPHWPYIAPAPYHAMFGREDLLPVNRSERERETAHPVFAAYMRHVESRSFSSDEIRAAVAPVYMGLIRQVDDHLARLWRFMEERALFDNTMIVITSDHGDYLGDHWLGEKELFHEESVRIPLVVYDPDAAADATRGTACGRMVEAIDLAATFVDAVGGPPLDHILEGRSLLSLTRGKAPSSWRSAAVSELDYAFRQARASLDVAPDHARAYMLRTEQWKYVLFEGFRPQLFDLRNDPRELHDLGDDEGYSRVRSELHEQLFEWSRGRKTRITIDNEEVRRRANAYGKRGVVIGEW